MTKFASLSVDGWRQFSDIDLHIHPRLTIITGSNGAGKSTLLSLCSRHFGFNRAFLSTPIVSKVGTIKYSLGVFNWLQPRKSQSQSTERVIGQIKYDDGQQTNISVSDQQAVSYDINMPGQRRVVGIHIDSHRSPNLYRHVQELTTTPITFNAMHANYEQELREHYAHGRVSRGSLWHLKSALLNMVIFGYGNQAMPPNAELVQVYEGFQEKLKAVLPHQISFISFSVRSPEIVLQTRSGDFVLDSASGGVIKLIEITWQIYAFSLANKSFVVTMDEPENHLHPSMQKTFLSNLVNAFSDVQFIVVTHSPFIVSSVRDSNVYVLRYDELNLVEYDNFGNHEISEVPGPSSKVYSELLDTVNKAGSASEILRDALGVPTTIPGWADDRLDEIMADYRGRPLTENLLGEMYRRFESEGLVSEYPKSISQLSQSK